MTNIVGQHTSNLEDQKVKLSKWTTGLDSVLEDADGTKVFESFLLTEGYLQYLEFLWACEGMKNIGHKQTSLVPQIVNCIYKHYILSGVLRNYITDPVLDIFSNKNELTYNEMMNMLNDLKIQVDVFLRNEVYPKFLESSIFSKTVLQQHDKPPLNSDSDIAHVNNAGKREIKRRTVEWTDWPVIGHNLYSRKIVFVLNNDDLPTNQTLITTVLGKSKRRANDPENFVKELTEKLQRLKLEQDQEEDSLKRVESSLETERTSQMLFSSKLAEALQEHIENENGNNGGHGKLETVKSDKLHTRPDTDTNIEKSTYSCHKSRIKNCLNLTIVKGTKKVRAKLQKCGKYSMNCMRQKERYRKHGHNMKVSKLLTKSRSLNFSDSEGASYRCSMGDKHTKNIVPHSSSYPSRIQNWINDGNKDPESDKLTLLK